MTRSFLHRQSGLPRSLALFRYVPERVRFSWRDWDPARVRAATDLPQYLILGDLDPSTFQHSANGWSARWQGTEDDTHFDVAYKADAGYWEIRQTWCGLDGGFSFYRTRIPLDKVIGQALYMQFPNNWDAAAKTQLESSYQITVVEQPEKLCGFCGIPDGAFRTIAFPIAVRNLRPVRQRILEIAEESRLIYPISVEAKLVFQAINYVEGKSPEWTTQEAVVLHQSVIETGLAPYGSPVREVASGGAAAWTLRREVYFLFITLPFAGLTDFLSRMASEKGPIRTTSDPDLRFELRPMVIPTSFEMQAEGLTLWDRERTTRSSLQFARPGEAKPVPNVEQFIDAGRNVSATLAKVEATSGEVVAEVEQIFERAMAAGSA